MLDKGSLPGVFVVASQVPNASSHTVCSTEAQKLRAVAQGRVAVSEHGGFPKVPSWILGSSGVSVLELVSSVKGVNE